MTDILAITNAAAGSHEEDDIQAAVRVLEVDHSVDVVATKTLDELRAALDDHPDVKTIAVLGGDGTLHAVVAALCVADRLATVRVALIPMGTGNDFARTIDISHDPATAAQQILQADPRPVDLIVDDAGGIVINAVHLGLGAEAAVAARPWKKVLGPVGYAIGALISGLSQTGAELDVRVDGEPVKPRGRTLQVAAGNGKYVGGGAELLPEADPSDGLMDVAISYANPLHRRLGYAFHLRRGEHHERDDVFYLRCQRLEVSGGEFRCSADGEIGEPQTSAGWTLEPGAVTMLLP